MIHTIIMAGGSGTRFWPASRKDNPKQLLAIAGDETMLQSTVRRMQGLCQSENVRVVTNSRLVDQIKNQLPEVPPECIIGEPCKRDTAPCVGLAAALVAAADPEGIMVVMPSDHVISDTESFQSAMKQAVQLVEENPERFLTFGIKPNYPATVFGYIERGERIGDSEIPTFEVCRFREKPDLATAEEFCTQGGFYWNSGIFVWKAKTVLDALRRYEPEMAKHLDTIAESIGTDDYPTVLDREFHAIQGTSIDFAIMERYPSVCVIEAPFDWDDVGNWTALERLLGKDLNANTLIGNQLTLESKNCIIRNDNDDGHLVATVGMENCVVIRTPDATLVVDKSREADVKKIVAALEAREMNQYL